MMKRWIAWMICLIMALALVPAALAEKTEEQKDTAKEAGFSGSDPETAALFEEPREILAEQTNTSGAAKGASGANGEIDVRDYSYEVTPLLAPFSLFLYVKTDNPDPTSFRLVDRTSRYYTENSVTTMWVQENSWTVGYELDPGTYYFSDCDYVDVVYENAETHRVKGGYLFRTSGATPDGGELVLQQVTVRDETPYCNRYMDTNVTIPCATMQSSADYLIETYVKDDMTFFEKLNAVEAGLYEISVYPRYVFDCRVPSEQKSYPLLASSPYPELSLNDHYLMYPASRYIWLLDAANPFVYDSLSFPGMIGVVAKMLEPDAVVEGNSVAHWMIDITFEGEKHMYGGAGGDGSDPYFSSCIDPVFTFDGSSGDFGTHGTIETYREEHRRIFKLSSEILSQYSDLVVGKTFVDTITATGGTWIRIIMERSGATNFAYALPCRDQIIFASNVWVDGRYLNRNEVVELGVPFADHPTAGIVLHDVTYTDNAGTEHTQDVLYTYSSSTDRWEAPEYYRVSSYGNQNDLPDALVLTRDEVEEIVRSWTEGNRLPESGLVYDGTEYPGTPFTITRVEGIVLPEAVTLYTGEGKTLDIRITPEDASYPLTWLNSSDETVVTCGETQIYGKAPGTAIITAWTADGLYEATCTVTVVDREIGAIEFAPGAVEYRGETPFVVWNGYDMTPEVIVKDTDGTVLDPSQYQVSYRDNWKPGTAFVDVKMKQGGNSKSKMFKIYLPPTEYTEVENSEDGIWISWEPVEGAKGYVIYRRAWNLTSAGWTTFERWNNTTDTDFTDKKVYAGTRYQYGIKAYFSDPMDNYNLGVVGPLKTTVRIPMRRILGVEGGKKQLTVRWDGSRYCSGYQVKLTEDEGGWDVVETRIISRPDVYRTTFKGLKSGREYFVSVRSYYVFEGMTYYGTWTEPVACKVK